MGGGTVGMGETTVAALAVGAAMLATDPVGVATGAMAEVDTRTEGIRMMISGEAEDENMLCGVLQVYLQIICEFMFLCVFSCKMIIGLKTCFSQHVSLLVRMIAEY